MKKLFNNYKRSRVLSLPYWIVFIVLANGLLNEISLLKRWHERTGDIFWNWEHIVALIVLIALFVLGIGIWRGSLRAYIAGLIFNLLLIGGGGIYTAYVWSLPCEGLGCLGAAYVLMAYLGALAVFLLPMSTILFIAIRRRKKSLSAQNP